MADCGSTKLSAAGVTEKGNEMTGFEDDDEASSWIPLETNDDMDPSSSSMRQREIISRKSRISSPSVGRSENTKLESLQRTLENRQLIRDGLFVHPLRLFPGKFASRFLVEILSLEPHIRVALSLITLGILVQALAILHFFASNMRCIVLVTLVLISYVLVYRGDQRSQLSQLVSSLDGKIFSGLENIPSLQLRRIFFVLAVIPPLLEMRTIVFLSHFCLGNWVFVAVTAVSTHAVMTLYSAQAGAPARDCSVRGYVCLYLCALLISLLRATTQSEDLSRFSVLASPFIIAAGSMVLSHHDGKELEWLSRPMQQALRLTLSEILSELQGNVMDDEMLQLATLRWIAEFWATGDAEASATTATAKRAATPSVPVVPDAKMDSSASSESITSENMTNWLQRTTDRMREEMNIPEQRSDHNHNCAGQWNKHEATSGLENLCSMLASMDVDSRAKPAVQAYRSSIERIPPSRNAALFIALIRRCPSLFAVIIWCLSGKERRVLQFFVTLLPLILVELRRVQEWASSCSHYSRAPTEAVSTSNHWLPPAEFSDTIFIMLVPDRYYPACPPQLLQLWNNILSSVTALERSLLAARCAQATCAATELVFTTSELTCSLGAEIAEKGWAYGLGILANDIYHFVCSGGPCLGTTRGVGAGYSAAAVSAYKSSQAIGRHIAHISSDDEGKVLISCVVDAIAASLGRGWIWRVQYPSTDCSVDNDELRTLQEVRLVRSGDLTREEASNEPMKQEAIHLYVAGAKQSVEEVSNSSKEPRRDHDACCPPASMNVGAKVGSNETSLDETSSSSVVGLKTCHEGVQITSHQEENTPPTRKEEALHLNVAGDAEPPVEQVPNSSKEPRRGHDTRPSASENIDTEVGSNEAEDQSLGESSSCSGHKCAQPTSHQEERSPSTCTEKERTECDSDDMSWDEIPTEQVGAEEDQVAEIVSQESVHLSNGDKQEAPDQPPCEQGGDDWVKWAGGGLALVATVVGGIALANSGCDNKNASDKDEKKNSNVSTKSTD